KETIVTTARTNVFESAPFLPKNDFDYAKKLNCASWFLTVSKYVTAAVTLSMFAYMIYQSINLVNEKKEVDFACRDDNSKIFDCDDKTRDWERNAKSLFLGVSITLFSLGTALKVFGESKKTNEELEEIQRTMPTVRNL